ncbi:carbon-nitrogen hydrolase family protein [Mycobacterium gordonae]|uniref:Nitrilase n=1 Tax=Mycobacterium gordonae TaxID=1778 RepID=A0A1X1X6J9_MYCGO|nr:carbon-nitrogen hydrolase family protein [Mycobacterium gordonae]MBI2701093.1 carbon-nitrogen hydrolase family protein [Mycobacterium sp.]MCQ4363298.1 carbon-nitrogen hydrolase family protein [Mycobacterium gordonae]MCV7006958.1 carbon-nitrogen hydrolase family protein [Mycobacterium gordonae]ODR21927.1 nitrilase [Mycobacterium gordonae]ORV94511.1 nitrilase [Mycobacterium gordonae]
MRCAAIQLEAVPADVDANLASVERLVEDAVAAGARTIALPEFFTTGVGFWPELAGAALPAEGKATELLLALARRHEVMIGGSLLIRDTDGDVRNAYLVVTPNGVAGRHDKDLPTMWENAFYVGGNDDGVIEAGDLTVGAAVCWELMRTQTVRRLRGRIDLAMTGSGWWSIPDWWPRAAFRRMEQRNAATAWQAAASFAGYVGAPVLHAAHAGTVRCRMPWLPLGYSGRFEGGTMIVAADGSVLASLSDGEGVVVADVSVGRCAPRTAVPHRFWLHPRGPLPFAVWHYQRWHGRRYYRRHVAAS